MVPGLHAIRGLLLVLVLASGCTASDAPATKAASTAQAPEPTVDTTYGSITGRVTDDELVPLAKARVGLLEATSVAETDAAGRFTINDLLPQTYSLVVEKLGYESAARKVAVVAGEVADVEAVLKPMALPGAAYQVSVRKAGQMHADSDLTAWYLNLLGVNNSNVNSLRCDPCQFVLHLPLNPEAALTEAMWPPSGNPLVNPDMCYYYYKDWSETSAGTFVHHWCLVSRAGYAWSESELKNLKGESAVKMYIFGATEGVSFEHRIDTWTTFAYGAELPEEYSALPPP